MKAMWITVLEGPIKVSRTSRRHLGLILESVGNTTRFSAGKFSTSSAGGAGSGGNGWLQ